MDFKDRRGKGIAGHNFAPAASRTGESAGCLDARDVASRVPWFVTRSVATTCSTFGNKRGCSASLHRPRHPAANPNVADFCATWPANVKPTSPVPKKGWEYVWVDYRDKPDTTANRMVKLAHAVYVEQVYNSGNFAGLGIGT
jgi:hypothetical protein